MTTYDISRMTPGERTQFAATGLAMSYLKALANTRDSTAVIGASGALRSFFNRYREELVIAMTAGGYTHAESELPEGLPTGGAHTRDDGDVVMTLVRAYFGAPYPSATGVSPDSAAALGRWWWSTIEPLISPANDIIVFSFLTRLEAGPSVDAGARLTAQAQAVVAGSYTTPIEPGAESSSQTARAMAAAIAEATGVTPGDAEVVLPEMRITGELTRADAIPPWAVAVGAVGVLTLGGGLVYVLGKRQRWWR